MFATTFLPSREMKQAKQVARLLPSKDSSSSLRFDKEPLAFRARDGLLGYITECPKKHASIYKT